MATVKINEEITPVQQFGACDNCGTRNHLRDGICGSCSEQTKTAEIIDGLKSQRDELAAALRMARECIVYCRAHHKNVQAGDGIPVEAFIDEALAKVQS